MGRFVRLQPCVLEDRSTPSQLARLDLAFNQVGSLALPFDIGGNLIDTASAIAIQADGKIVVVGSTELSATDTDFAIARLNSDGTLDTTFSGGRRAIGFSGNRPDQATAVAIQSDGKILVAGFSESDDPIDTDFSIIRLTSTGELDTTFGDNGRQRIFFDQADSTFEDKAVGVAVDSQGRILLAGSVAQASGNAFDFGVVRLLSDGSLDSTFDGDGRAVVGFNLGGTNSDRPVSLAVDSQDRVVVVGSVETGTPGARDFGIVRLTTNGGLDTQFQGTGRTTIAFNAGGANADVPAAVQLDSQGNIVIVGTVDVATGNQDLGVVRLTPDGAVDASFGGTGKLIFGFDRGTNLNDQAAALAIDPSTSRITIAATVGGLTDGNTDVGLLRLTSEGLLDRTLSSDGLVTLGFDRGGNNADQAAGVALDSLGRPIVLATIETTNRDFGIARLRANPQLSNVLIAGGPLNGTGRVYQSALTSFEFTSDFVGPSDSATTRPAMADLNGDGIIDQIFGTGPGGGSRVRIVLGANPGNADPFPVIEFDAFESGFTGGVFVAAADVDGDGRAEWTVSPDVGGGPRASVYSLDGNLTPVKRADFFGIDDPDFRGGARVAMGDLDRDGRAELLVGAGFLGGPRVAIFSGATLFSPDANGNPPKLVNDFFAFPGKDAETLRNGVFLTIGDLDGDGFGDLVFGGGPGGGPRVYALDGELILNQQFEQAYDQPLANFFVGGDTESRGGVRLTVKDLDGDVRADLITASGDQLTSEIRVYRGATFVQPNGVEPPLAQTFDPFGDELFSGVFVG